MLKSKYVVLLFLLASCELEEWSEKGALVPPTVDEDASLPSLAVNGTLLHVEAYGNPEDPLLIMIHGGPGGDFRSLLKAKDLTNQGFYVVFYDQRGSGLSKREPKEQFEDRGALKLFIDDLDGLISHFRQSDEQPVFLFGHSWGAMLAAAFINEYPQKITGAVLAEPGGLTWPQAKAYVSRALKMNVFSEEINDAVFPEQIFAGRSTHEILDYKAGHFIVAENAPGNAIGNAGPYPFWRSGAVSHKALTHHAEKYGFDFTANLTQYSTEVLFLYSELSKAYGADWAAQVSAPFPHVTLQEVKNSGHEMLYFGWNDLYHNVLTYLNKLK